MTQYLIIHEDKELVRELEKNFKADGFNILASNNIEEGLKIIEEEKKENIDIALVGGKFSDGTVLDLKRRMSEITDIPTIVMSKNGETKRKILALEYGCDDYIMIPFEILELKARIRAVLRRFNQKSNNEYSFNNFELSKDGFKFGIIGRKVSYNDKELFLTGIEFDLLFIFVSNRGKVFTREELADIVWPNEEKKKLRTVDVHIKRLRTKLEEIENSPKIETQWSEGYFMERLY